jgi:type I restriction enzyme M protein
MADMLAKVMRIAGLSSAERRKLERQIQNQSLIGIDAGSKPAIHRIARMNMYLHGDGGSNIYFADALDKRVGLVGRSNIEIDDEIRVLRRILLTERRKFNVILSNPPFSLRYSRDTREQQEVLNQYDIGGIAAREKSLLSSVMFLERYSELVAADGRY